VSRRNPTTRRSISLKIDANVIAQLLRLDPTMRILGSRSEIHGDQHTLVFSIDAPKAPPDALEVQPVYARDAGEDPIRLAHVDWLLRSGERMRQAFPAPDTAQYLAQLRAASEGQGPSEQDIAEVNAARTAAGLPPLEL
jgi:hypothetical protein